METNRCNTCHNYYIDFFRIFAISWIVLFHYTSFEDLETTFSYRFSSGGTVGVALFFVISGFLFGKQIFNKDFSNIGAYLQYCLNRYLRFWPAYAISIVFISIWLFFLPLPSQNITFKEIFINFFLIFHPGVDYVEGVDWFLAYLLIMQYITVTLIFLAPKNRYILILLMFVVCYIYSSYIHFVGRSSTFLSHLSLCETKLLYGVIIYNALLTKSKFRYAITLFMGGAISLKIEKFDITIDVMVLITQLALFFVLIKKLHIPHSLFYVKYLGEVSFIWYLVHNTIGHSIISNFLPIGNINVLYLSIPILLTIVISFFIQFIVDRIGVIKYKI